MYISLKERIDFMITDLRHVQYEQRLHQLGHGKYFMLNDKLHVVVEKYSAHNSEKYLIVDCYNVSDNKFEEIPISKTITPVEIKIDILKNIKGD